MWPSRRCPGPWLGWNVGYDGQGRIRWSHSGAFNLGAATCVDVLPSERIGIAVLTNTNPTGVPEAVGRSFLDLVLTGKVERDWLALFGQAMASIMAPDYGTAVDYSKPPPQRSSSLANAAYVGRYRNDLYGPAEIAESAGGLVLKLGPKQSLYATRHFDRDVFTYQPVGENAYGLSALTFRVGADHKAAALTIENLDGNGQGTFVRATS